MVRGGIGLFQNLPGTQTIGNALTNTGLPSAVRQITCVGSSTPAPNWSAYSASTANIDTTCAGAPTVFASSAPNVTAFSQDYVSPRSIRGNIQWSGATLKNRLNTSIDFTASYNLNQSSSVDRNFDPSQDFTLPLEANRPVFVPTSAIVPGTVQISSSASRFPTETSCSRETATR